MTSDWNCLLLEREFFKIFNGISLFELARLRRDAMKGIKAHHGVDVLDSFERGLEAGCHPREKAPPPV